MGRYYVWEAMTYFNKRSSLGRVVINPPQKLKASKPLKQGGNYWFICKCGRAFKEEDKYREHKKSHPKDFSADWTLRGQQDISWIQGKTSAGRLSMHKCGQCGKLLQSAPALKNHMFIHTGEKPWQCDKCPAVFRLYSTLYDHKKVSHVPGGKFKCPECPCRFTAQLGLKRHLGIYHPKMIPDAVVKGKTDKGMKMSPPGKGKLTSAVISEDGTRSYPCHYCGKVFYKSQYLRNHYPVHTGERKSICNLCGVAFKSSSNLLAHKKVSHVDGGTHRCEKCPCVFASLLGLVRHRRLFHGKANVQLLSKKIKQKNRNAMKFPVMSQRKEVNEDDDLIYEGDDDGEDRQEMVDENAGEANTYECNECGKVLSSLLCLRNHQMIHTGEKPWICNLCGAAFRLNSTLYGHKKTSHVPNGPYKCDECSCRFAAVFGLKRHKICFHEGAEGPAVVGEASGKISKCPYCPKAFKSSASLQQHMLVHRSEELERPAICPKCNGAYTTKRALRKHMKTAHVPGGKKCPLCSCSFLSSQALKAHHTKVHLRSNFLSLKDHQPVIAAVKALKSRGVTVEPTRGSSDDLLFDGSVHTCDRCNKNFSSQASLKNHQRYCSQENIMCDICGEGFSIYSNMIRHKRTCHVPNGQYKCSYCTHCYSTTRGYARHMAHAHGEYKRGQGVAAKPAMSRPGLAIQRIIENSKMRTVTQQQQRRPYHRVPDSLRKYRCNLCGNAFSTSGNYKKHMITSHVPGGKFPCSSCACVFNTYNALNSHVGNRHSTKYDDAVSPSVNHKTEPVKLISPKRATSASPQKSSTPTLSKIKFNFFRPNTSLPSLPSISSAPRTPQRKPPTELMKRMARLVGGSSPPKDVPNLIPAPVLFTPKVREPEIEEDESETEEHSPEVAALLDDGSSHPRCDICGKTYSNMHSLRGHMTVHTGEKPFPCNQCGQRFRQKGDVVSHKKTNHSDGKFKCALCPCRFLTAQGLKRHKAQIHGLRGEEDFVPVVPKKALPVKPPQSLATIMKARPEKPETVEYSKVTLTFGSVASESRQPAQSVTNRTKPGSREFDCDLCDASFNHQQNLIRHRKSSHVPWGEFKCSSCSCSFVSATSLRTHEAIFHQRKSEKNQGLVKPKNSGASERNNSFDNRDDDYNEEEGDDSSNCLSRTPKLIKDARGRNAFLCELCGATFNSHGNCSKHLSTSHVDGGQYACGRCPCIFISFKGLARHESIYHASNRGMKRQLSSQIPMKKFKVEIEHHASSEEESYGHHSYNRGATGRGEQGAMYTNQYEDEEEALTGNEDENGDMDPLDTSSGREDDADDDRSLQLLTPKVEVTAVLDDEESDALEEEALNALHSQVPSSAAASADKNATEDRSSGGKPHGTVYGAAGALPKERVNRFAVYAKKEQHICGICKLSFTQASGLKGHMRIHTGDKPYQCRYCGICFRLSGTLAQHVKKCHEQENPYQCEFCSCTFIAAGVLSQHILKFHPSEIKEDEA